METFKKLLIVLSLLFFILSLFPLYAAEYEASEIAKHNSEKDCWMVIRKKVYNLSSYIPEHPTQPKIMVKFCGKDATKAYDNKGGLDEPHNDKANKLLPKYEIGTLKE